MSERQPNSPRRGLRRRGGLALLAIAWISLLVWRAPRMLAFLESPTVERVVALSAHLLAGLALVWLARRELRARPAGGETTRRAASSGLAPGVRRPSGTIVLPAGAIAMLAFIALLAPLLATQDPDVIPEDLVTTRYLPPGSTVHVFGDVAGGELFASSFRIEGDEIVLERGSDTRVPPLRRALTSLGEPLRGWRTLPPGAHVSRLTLAGRKIPHRRMRYLLGTDDSGRDLFSRLVHGARISMAVGVLAMLVAVGLGTLVGSVAGYGPDWLDAIVARLVDGLLSFPRLLLLVLVLALWRGAGLFTVVVLLGLTGWMSVARLVRAEIRRLRTLDFADSARALGASAPRVVLRHLLPLALTPILVAATFRIADAILLEAALSFLGLGVEPPTATWGSIVNDGRTQLAAAWWISSFAGLAIVFTVLAFHALGESLRRSLDPRARW